MSANFKIELINIYKKNLKLPIMSMIRFILIFLLLIGCGSDDNTAETPAKNVNRENLPVFLFIGDSLTAGYGIDIKDCFVSLFQKEFEASQIPFQTKNAGISGETSSGTLSRIEWLMSSKPKVVFLCTGSNDGLRGISAELYRQNLERIIQTVKKTDCNLILGGIRLPVNFGLDYANAMANVPKNLSEKYNLLYYPFLLDGVAANFELNQSDYIHPNEKGHKVIFERLNKFFKKNDLY